LTSEVRRLVQEAYDTARRILTEKRAQLDARCQRSISKRQSKRLILERKSLIFSAGKRRTREDMPAAPTNEAHLADRQFLQQEWRRDPHTGGTGAHPARTQFTALTAVQDAQHLLSPFFC
jgi:cell division protease FtsH